MYGLKRRKGRKWKVRSVLNVFYSCPQKKENEGNEKKEIDKYGKGRKGKVTWIKCKSENKEKEKLWKNEQVLKERKGRKRK